MLFEGQQKQPSYFTQIFKYPDLCKTLKAKQLIEEDPNEAMLVLDECINKNPENYIAITLKGGCLLQLGRIEEAKLICQQIQKLYPKYYLNLKLQQAILIKEDKDLRKSFENLFIKFMKQNQNGKAEELLDEIPEYFKNEAAYKQFVQFLEARSGAQQKQEFNNNKEFKTKEEKLALIQFDFWVLVRQERQDEALTKLEEGLQLDGTNLICLQLKALILYMQYKFSEAREIYNLMKQISPNSSEVIAIESFFYRIFETKPLFHNEVKLENLDKAYIQAQSYILSYQYDEAIKIYKQILSIDVTYYYAQLYELFCHIQNKQIDYALKQIEDKLKYSSDFLKLLQLKGLAMFKKQEFEKALKIFEEIEAINSNYLVLFSKANCLFKLKKYDAAMKIYETSLESIKQPKQIQSMKMRIYKCFFANDCQDPIKKNQILSELFNNDQKKINSDGCHYGLLFWIWVVLLQQGFFFSESFADSVKQKIQNSEIIQFIYATNMIALGKIDISIQLYDQILQQNPKHLLALVGMNSAFLFKNNSQLAENYKNQALKINCRAFDKVVQDEILISDLEDLFEKDSMNALFLSNYENSNQFSMLNILF